MSRPLRITAIALFVVGGLAACTSSGDTGSSTAPTTPPTSTSVAPTSSSAPSTTSSPTTPLPLATFTKLTGKATTLHFDAGFVKVLYTHGISTAATGDSHLVAVRGSSNAVVPISAGSATLFESAAKTRLNLRHTDGGLKVSSSAGSIQVKDLVLHLGTKPLVSATLTITKKGKVQPAQTTQLFDLTATSSFRATVHDKTATVSGLRLYLTPKVAKTLDGALGSSALSSGKRRFVGTVTIELAR